MRILLIENHLVSDDFWRLELKRYGHDIDRFDNFPSGERALAVIPYCAVIINIKPLGPLVSKILSRWRRDGIMIPVLVLANERRPANRSAVINAGADDCMETPADPMEMMARISAIVRRRHAGMSSVLKHREVTFDMISREVRREEQLVALTGREVTLLEIFLMNSRRVITKDFLERKMCTWHRNTASNVVEVHISNLRRKLGKSFIHTLYGQGYILGKD